MPNDSTARGCSQDAGPALLVRVFSGVVGPAHPDDGAIVRLPAALARELVGRGDAAPVTGARLSLRAEVTL